MGAFRLGQRNPLILQWRHSRVLLEETPEERGSGKVQVLGYLQGGQVGCQQQAFRLGHHHLVYPVAYGVVRYLFDSHRQVFGGQAQLVGIECDTALRPVVLRQQFEERSSR